MKRIQYEELKSFTEKILKTAGLDEYSLQAVSNGLCETSLRGVDSHGVRLLPHYHRSALNGRKNPRPKMRFSQTFHSMGSLDADNAFGHAAGMYAMERCMEMAKESGVGVVGVMNSSHPGAMASFTLHAARKGFMAFAFTHADSLILSHDGIRPFFGTNPICFAAPRKEEEPFCLDMATSIIPWNRLLLSRVKGESLNTGIAADRNGCITENPDEAVCLMPTGGYKGYGLAAMVEVLCAIFTGMAFGRDIPVMYKSPMDQPRHLGQFFMAMRCDGCIDHKAFLASLTRMGETIRNEPGNGQNSPILPGDKEIQTAQNRSRYGIPVDSETIKSFIELSQNYGVTLNVIPE